MRQILILISLINLASCAPSRIVKPLEKGEQSLALSLGGPMAKVPGLATIPIPFTNLSYNRGIGQGITLSGSLYPTAILFGTYQFDLGLNYGWVKKDNWGISSTLLLNNAIDQWQLSYKLWPNVDLNGYYEWNRENTSILFYGGANNWFELSTTGAHDRPQKTHWIFSPQLGVQIIRSKWSYQIEYKIIGPNLNNQNFVVSYSSILSQSGANGLYFGVSRKF